MKQSNSQHIDFELSIWKEKLEKILAQFAAFPSRKKAKLMGTIMELHIMDAELDDRIALLKESGYDNGDYWDNSIRVNIDEFRSDFTESSEIYMDYDYSG